MEERSTGFKKPFFSRKDWIADDKNQSTLDLFWTDESSYEHDQIIERCFSKQLTRSKIIFLAGSRKLSTSSGAMDILRT